MRRRSRSRTRPEPGGFTLVELLVVLAIIGILLAFIMSAAMDGVRRSEERATQALISKLEAGLTDRVDAIYATRADSFPAHQYLAGIWISSTWAPGVNPVASNNRAQVLARLDQIKAELPDVFVVQGDANYPLNFLASPYPLGTEITGTDPMTGSAFPPTGYGRFLLPLGAGVANDPANGSFGSNPPMANPYFGGVAIPPNTLRSTGIFGATYAAAAGLYKSLFDKVQRDTPGVGTPKPANAGFDGVDNNNNGLVDEIGENDMGLAAGTISGPMKKLLANHTHKTARAEMLYATLVEGAGPYGSVFSRDDFSDSEVKDTDGDGLPEFVDAWGEPVQYFRWPIFYQSDTQRGPGVYGVFETRDLNTLDPNQTLVDPAWFGAGNNGNSPYGTNPPTNAAKISSAAVFFQSYFHSLTDPNTDPGLAKPAPTGFGWDRGSSASPYFARREYYSKPLIISGGPDKAPGVPVLDATYFNALGAPYAGKVIGAGGAGTGATTPTDLLIESQAAQATPARSAPFFSFGAIYPSPAMVAAGSSGPGDPLSTMIREAGHDDITNHNLSGPGGAIQ